MAEFNAIRQDMTRLIADSADLRQDVDRESVQRAQPSFVLHQLASKKPSDAVTVEHVRDVFGRVTEPARVWLWYGLSRRDAEFFPVLRKFAVGAT